VENLLSNIKTKTVPRKKGKTKIRINSYENEIENDTKEED